MKLWKSRNSRTVKPCGLRGLGSQARNQAWASGVGAPSPRCWNARELLTLGNTNQQDLSWRSLSQLQDPAPPNCLQAPVLNATRQTTSKTGPQTHPSADRLPKVIKPTDTPKHNTWRGPAHQREKIQLHSPERRHQSHPSGSLHKPLD